MMSKEVEDQVESRYTVAVRNLRDSAERLLKAFTNVEEHPEDPHGADEVDYSYELVDKAVDEYRSLK